MGLLLILALAGAAIALAATQSPAKPKPAANVVTPEQTIQISSYAQIPAILVPQFVGAIKSGSAQTALAIAAWFRSQGYTHAADLLTQAAGVANPTAPTAGATQQTPPPATASVSVTAPAPAPAAPTPSVASPTVAPQAVEPSTLPPVPPPALSQQAPAPAPVPPAPTLVPSVAVPSVPSVSPAPSAPPVPAIPSLSPIEPTTTVPQAIPEPTIAPAGTVPTTATTPSTPAGQDPPLPPSIQALLENVLRTAHDPAIIYQAADMLQANGYPRTAAELRKRAVAIASSQVDPIAIIQDILHQADQVKPPTPAPTAPTSPSSPGPTVPTASAPPAPMTPAPGWTSPGIAPPVAPGDSSPAVPSAAPNGAPSASTGPTVNAPGGISLNIPTQINVPSTVIPPFTAPQVPPPPAGTRFYVVEPGDNLSKIAKKFTGNPNRWPEMAKINPEANQAGHVIHPGQRLKIPPSWPNADAAGPVISVPMPSAAPVPSASSAGPMATSGYNPDLARSLAPAILDDVAKNKAKYDRARLKTFQTAAGLPSDGDYGPRTAGAIDYFSGASGPPSLPQYGSGKKAYAPPRSTPPLKTKTGVPKP